MRFFSKIVSFILALSVPLSSVHAADSRLDQFNQSTPSDGASADESDTMLISAFKGRPFVCRNAVDYTPLDADEAKGKFSEFVRYTKQGDADEKLWLSETNRKKRDDLLKTAVDAGSWKAAYVDSIWSIRFPSSSQSRQNASRQLEQLVRQGIPIAAYKYATYLYGRDDEMMYYLLKQAIDRGSPNAMELVGRSIIARSKQLRSLAKAMLDCAANQGNANAYAGLGRLADMEGHKIDAFHLWVKGLNSGCDQCVDNLARLAKIRNGYDPDNVSMIDLLPELKRITQFYTDSFMYGDTELPDLFRPLPVALEFHPSDDELLKLLEFEASADSE
ncbi:MULTISPECIES: hypothetical protein [unclassified Caballeronia]|uniref:hypothetical protein n=1 Tax=unclassified Caballeronia TaxID=2646786 RepID=UPI00285E0184|nr:MULTISPECIES: hypothetical protein [unclassified Caballeronia]MDR5751373.1 hypothetical protein [Caballeronia sp. LZ024]MDR5844485.1 hypothetical protein [Caballeronia sp. LZ031]